MSNAIHRVNPLLHAMLLGLLVAAPVAAFAQKNAPGSNVSNVPGTAGATIGTQTVTGTQTIAETGGCSQVSVNIKGNITGTVDDGGGLDQVRYELWDDGVMKDSKVVSVPVGSTQMQDVTLGFQGLYGTGAPGVGVLITDQPSGGLLFDDDPFIPTDVVGVCASPTPVSSATPTRTPTSVATSTPIPIPQAPAPTLSPMGLLGLVSLLGTAGGIMIWRKRHATSPRP